MTNSTYQRKRRQVLFAAQNGLCHWCGTPMVEVPRQPGERLPPDACTLDHLFDRFDPNRTNPRKGEKRTVAACHECNSRRGKEGRMADMIRRATLRAEIKAAKAAIRERKQT